MPERSRSPERVSVAAPPPRRLRSVKIAYSVVYLAIVVLFGVCAVSLIVLACSALWHAVDLGSTADGNGRLQSLLEGIGLLTIAVASLELSQTVLEEEVLRDASMSTPTRARRFLSRFMLVIVVSLGVEFLVLVFELIHTDTKRLPDAAALGFGAAALLVAWGLFVRFNVAAEKLEPEAMEEVKREDEQVS
ncbi:MAG TPA: hypothetical protein VJR89_39130 [Polyangiales bacterium]|nr:hypothetical protein [Polyangiales bacterium]